MSVSNVSIDVCMRHSLVKINIYIIYNGYLSIILASNNIFKLSVIYLFLLKRCATQKLRRSFILILLSPKHVQE